MEGFEGAFPIEWCRAEVTRLNRKIAKIGHEAKNAEALAKNTYQKIGYLYKEVYELERAIMAESDRGQ